MNRIRRMRIDRNKKDKQWSIDVRNKYLNKCAIPNCECTEMLNAHHIIPREFQETRWDINNGVALCPKHHKFGKYSAHKNALWFIRVLLREDLNRMNQLGDIMDNISRGE